MPDQGCLSDARCEAVDSESLIVNIKNLELKVPPLLWVAIYGLLMKGCSLWLTSMTIGIPLANRLALALAGLGLSFVLAGVRAVRRSQSTIDPRHPENTTSVVETGIYAVTRNPIYVGLLLLLGGWAVYLQNLAALGLEGLFMATLTHLQIRPEERFLEQRFGDAYLSYVRRVPRWLFFSSQ